MAKTSTERMREYRERIREKKKQLNITKKPAKSAAERAREYRARKKAKEGGLYNLNLDSSSCEELSINIDPSNWFSHKKTDENHESTVKSCNSTENINSKIAELPSSNMEKMNSELDPFASNLKQEIDLVECANVELSSLEEGRDIKEIKHELPEELHDIPIKQEYPDPEYSVQINKDVIKQEFETETNREVSNVWVKEELNDDNLVTQNSKCSTVEENGESSKSIKQEYDMEDVSISKIEKPTPADSDDDVSFVCDIPPRETTRKKRMKVVISNSLYKCPKCRFVAKGFPSLDKHMNNCHTKLICTWCNYHTFSTSQLKAHVQKVHVHYTYKTLNGPEPVCDIGNDINVQKTPTNVNKVQNISEKSDEDLIEASLECSYCEYQARTPKHLEKHTLIHSNLKEYRQPDIINYTCPNCTFGSEYKKLFLAHKLNCQRYRCSERYCRYSTKTRDNLWDHIIKEHRNQTDFMEKYTKFQPQYKCAEKYCKFRTNNSEYFARHLEAHQKKKDSMEETNGKTKKFGREYNCSEKPCKYTTRNREDLWGHIIEEHRQKKKRTEIIIKCNWCSFSSDQTTEVKEHVQQVHVKSTYKSTNIQK